tara:strand:- start:449 stop:799 length:351 start_codon:yes stop_codon:yes gene_type:complete
MNIIIGKDEAERLAEKYTVLPLETMKFKSNPDLPPTTAYCIIETIPTSEMNKIEELKALHTKFYENYQKGDFNFCEQALEHLKGKWGGEIDSYYNIMEDRISKYKDAEDFDPILYK